MCLIYDYAVLLVMVGKNVLRTVSDISTKLDVKKKRNMFALQFSSDLIWHNSVSKSLGSIFLLVINEKYYLL